jgi:hypothetical protein
MKGMKREIREILRIELMLFNEMPGGVPSNNSNMVKKEKGRDGVVEYIYRSIRVIIRW